MEKTKVVCLLLLLLLTSFSFQNPVTLKSETWDANYIIESKVTYTNKGHKMWNLTEEDRTVRLFMNNTWQTVNLTDHSHPLENVTLDEDGNPIVLLQFQSELSPGESKSYSVTYQVLSRQRWLPTIAEEESWVTENITEALRQKYCKEDDTWQTENQIIREQAHSIAQNETNVLRIVTGFIEWIWRNITYESYEVPQYPNQTLASGKGDCDDQAILLVTFCRILRIPAYLQIGCIYTSDKYENETGWNGHVTNIEKRIGWHGWAMVYVPPWGWLPVDLTYVKGSRDNPLNAIRNGAVSSYIETIQYANISEMDYVASSLNYRKFIIENDFYICEEDEMTLISKAGLWESLTKKWVQRVFIILVIATCSVIVVYAYISREKKKQLRETGSGPEKLH
ncbi:MAG: transglutaminase domain-containing protein [Candidatus Bathyarchaeota archaeon]|nr:MAG: transglutaminase domain-containing protein [Candidatus Bathyarchaeota archaeon]